MLIFVSYYNNTSRWLLEQNSRENEKKNTEIHVHVMRSTKNQQERYSRLSGDLSFESTFLVTLSLMFTSK